jgi:hypothetical protein
MGTPYINGIKHNAYIGGEKIWALIPDGAFSITVEGSSFSIPTRGVNNSGSQFQSYNWKINWGDAQIQTVSGTGSITSSIPHTYTDEINTHIIIITPNGTPTQGWLNAFGCYNNFTEGKKVKSINIPTITSLMRSMNTYSFFSMFRGCTGLTAIPANLLPSTTLAEYCYSGMFMGCTGLTTIPANLLPSTTLTEYCYNSMFRGCTGLTAIPANLLPSTNLVNYCYNVMFIDCSNLTNIGNMNAAWFAARESKQQIMFSGCTKITTPITYANIPTGWK